MCVEEGCSGAVIDGAGHCLAHASHDEVDAALARFVADGRVEADGVPLDAALVRRIVEAHPLVREQHVLGSVNFGQATFDAAPFSNATFLGFANFMGATFKGDAEFDGVRFREEAWFSDTHFEGHTEFRDARFADGVKFGGSRFVHSPIFDGATFSGPATFFTNEKVAPHVEQRTTFERRAHFIGTRFEAPADFSFATFGLAALFDQATFLDGAEFDHATFIGDAVFTNARFTRDPPGLMGSMYRQEVAVSFAGATFGGAVELNGATFGESALFNGARFSVSTHLTPERTGGWSFRKATFQDALVIAGDIDGAASFEDAVFDGEVDFSGAKFSQPTSFERAAFHGPAIFSGLRWDHTGSSIPTGTSFDAGAKFDSARFHDCLVLSNVKCVGGPGIRVARGQGGEMAREALTLRDAVVEGFADLPFVIDGRADLSGAEFRAVASVHSFLGDVDFMRTRFLGYATFENARFEGDVRFNAARFDDIAWFEDTTFERDVNFMAVTFARTPVFGPLTVHGALSLVNTTFNEAVDARISARALIARRAEFRRGINLRVRWADIDLEEADFGGPSTLAGGDDRFGKRDDRPPDAMAVIPRLLSVRRANVKDLFLADVDLSACRFVGAHNLDHLRLGARTRFARAPSGWRHSDRQVVAEEHRWRADQKPGSGWYPDECLPGYGLKDDERTAGPAEIAPVYRALRKGREDAKDEPGAADFYYGEMELRRTDRGRPAGERAILTSYWLVSGYGLRASRALGALLLTIAVFTLLLWWVGFEPRPPFIRALLVSAESTSSLFRVPELNDTSLSYAGEALQIVLRLLGPLFFALALLSLRNRVKR